MGASPSVESMLKGAKDTLSKANNFQKSVTGGKEDVAAKPSATAPPAPSRYSHVREARKSPGEFLGVRSDQAAEINSALKNREDAKTALEPN